MGTTVCTVMGKLVCNDNSGIIMVGPFILLTIVRRGFGLWTSDFKFIFGRNFAKFQPEKYDFNLYKGFFMEKKKAQFRQISRKKKFPDRQSFIIRFSK
jgi:hypothetical protein